MSAIAQQKCLIKERLFQFITKHIPTANLKVIDDIVLAYVVSILEEASQDPCFDLEGFMEMMAAYIPEFESIDPGLVCSWVLELEAELSQRDESDHSPSPDGDKIEYNFESLADMLPTITKTHRSRTNSETMEFAIESDHCAYIDTVEYANQCRLLHEMFPNTNTMEIKHCVSIAGGVVDRAAATLLHRREHGQALETAALCAARPPPPRCDDRELKTRIIARYSYVDKNSDLKEHKPLAPKFEPKKMVRYRDNKIVSLKGERYTEVPKAGIDEENLKKPKKQHCP